MTYSQDTDKCDSALSAFNKAVREMDLNAYIRLAHHLHGQGKAEGMAEILLKQLTTRYGALSAAVAARIREASSTTELEGIAERVLTAKTLDEALSAG